MINNSRKIKAEVTNSFFGIVDRLFDNAPTTVLSEIIQNSRRAGASFVKITSSISQTDNCLQLTIDDDGEGVSDMADLLRIRSSGWDESIMRTEDPAGMGFFSLCRMKNLHVYSKDQKVFMGVNCEAFNGSTEVSVELSEDFVDGTRLQFDWPDMTRRQIVEALQSVAKFATIKVFLDDQLIEQTDFKPVRCVEEYEDSGLSIYIYNCPWESSLRFNFGGIVVFEEADDINDFRIAIDVKDTSKLQMVLPARNAIVHNKFYNELMQEARRRIYKIIAARGSHTLPYKYWLEAQNLGVDIGHATERLVAGNSAKLEDLESDKFCVLMNSVSSRGNLQAVAAAMDKHGQFKLYEAMSSMEGYDWYDRLPRVCSVEYMQDGSAAVLDGAKVEQNLAIIVRFDGDFDTICLPADILIGRIPYGEDSYSRAMRLSKGFTVATNANIDSEYLSEIIDRAWRVSYASDSVKAEWDRLRSLDVIKCVSKNDDALANVLKKVVEDALKDLNMQNFEESTVNLRCSIDCSGAASVEIV